MSDRGGIRSAAPLIAALLAALTLAACTPVATADPDATGDRMAAPTEPAQGSGAPDAPDEEPAAPDDVSEPDAEGSSSEAAADQETEVSLPTLEGPIVPVGVPDPKLPATATTPWGEEVQVTDVSRVLPLSGAISEVVFNLGFADAVVGRDVEATFTEAEDVPLVTHGHEVSPEGVLSLQPTVVLVDARTGPPEALEAIAAAGVPVVEVPEAWTLDDVWPRMRAIASALGVPELGEALVERTQAQIRQAAGELQGPPPRVAFLYLRGSAGVYLLGGDGSGADALIESLGAIDAGTEMGLGPYTPLTSEALAKAAPDVLLVMQAGLDSVGGMDGLLALPGVAQTPAAAERRVIAVEDGALLSFGPRTPAVIALLREQLQEVLR